MSHIIAVNALAAGWSVEADDLENPLMFRAGSHAEAAAKSLAEGYALAGKPSEIRIFLRDGSLGGRFVCGPHGLSAGL